MNVLQWPKSIVYGIRGALIFALPVSVLKVFIYYAQTFGWLCKTLGVKPYYDKIFLPTTCGLMYVNHWTLDFWSLVYFIFILIGGALFGFGCERIVMRKTGGAISDKEIAKNTRWLSFIGGILFDVLFVFILPYFGSG
ncbi:MAG: hypothetical protein ACOYYS_11315 [Chloroflexota bacterium]